MEEELCQVNGYYSVCDKSYEYGITRYNENGYRGSTTGTCYAKGCDYTDWCLFVGTQEECEKFIAEKYNN